MDITFRLVITFIVILAVGSSILVISNNILSNSEGQVEKTGKVASDEKLISMSVVSSEEVRNLAEDCYNRVSGMSKPELCYIVNSEDSGIVLSGQDFPGYVAIVGFEDGKNTAYINFIGGQVQISNVPVE